MTFPAIGAERLPWISVGEMREVDRVAVELGVDLTRMMENAGASVAALARELLGGDVRRRNVVVLAGSGGNGGGGLVAARRLLAAGARVDVRLAESAERLAPVPREQHAILCAAGAGPTVGPEGLVAPDLVVDALLGYGQQGPPRGAFAQLVRWSRGRRVLALDVPTGLVLEDGTIAEPVVEAEATLTLALPKRALRARGAEKLTGDLFLADVSIPPAVYERLGIGYESPFGGGAIVRITQER